MKKRTPPWTEIPKRPVIDSGPLFESLLWRFSESFDQPDLISRPQYLKTSDDRAALAWYLPLAKPIVTSPEVIAEIHGRVTREARLRQPRLGDFWKFSQKELSQLGLAEELVKLVEMEPEILSRFGPTDTSLIRLGSQFRRPVLTEDGPLGARCKQERLEVLTTSDILSLFLARERSR